MGLVCIAAAQVPSIGWAAPFAVLLLCIAALPLIPRAAHWWEQNPNKLTTGLILGAITLFHYSLRSYGVNLHDPSLVDLLQRAGFEIITEEGHHLSGPGPAAAVGAIGNAVFEYVPFVVLLFSLYCVSGGIAVRGDMPAGTLTNTAILGAGGLLASLIGTTGASIVLIRPLLRANRDRKNVAHTVVFFIFIVSNIGGCMLPIGDPPLFLGYLAGVPFFWTLCLWKAWSFALISLLVVYFIWDTLVSRSDAAATTGCESSGEPVRVEGKVNVLWLLVVVAVVATLVPGKPFPGTGRLTPPFLREAIQLAVVGLSFLTTPRGVREANQFRFTPIAEVACLFFGIFITMQIPVEILNARGGSLGLTQPWQFFWATGLLSACLDNAPTYVVFFQTAVAMSQESGGQVLQLLENTAIPHDLLAAISLGAVFMGALSYIGNGPNFMVKAIAEAQGVKMPSFLGYVFYSGVVLGPLFLLVTIIFF